MKKLFFSAIIFSFTAIHAQVKIAKITKSQVLEARDEYNRIKENFLKMKFTLSNGESKIFEKNLKPTNYDGVETWYYQGLNYEKDAIVMLMYWDNGGYDNHYKVVYYEYRFDAKSKKYKLQELEVGPDMEWFGTFRIGEGWSYVGFQDGTVILNKNGVEWFVTTAKKTNGQRYLTAYEMGGD